MRTKTLLLTAALGAAGVASAVAQVYSVNAVGYVNKTLCTGFNLMANPLNTGGNKLTEVHPTVPDEAMVYTFNSSTATFVVYTYLDGTWNGPSDNPTPVLAPGTGSFLRVAQGVTVTYVGEVPQGTLSIPLVAGFNLVGSKVPQAGKITADLGYTPVDGDQVYTYNPTAGYTIYTYDAEWLPAEPVLKVSEGIWIRKAAAGAWNRTFSVNP
jgi:hypothetical protein